MILLYELFNQEGRKHGFEFSINVKAKPPTSVMSFYDYASSGTNPEDEQPKQGLYQGFGLHEWYTATAEEIVPIWKEQGWHPLHVQLTFRSLYGPVFYNKVAKLIKTLNIGPWTAVSIERSESVVFATAEEADIEPFRVLLKKPRAAK